MDNMFKKKKKMENKKWNDLSIKERLAVGSACIAFLAGWTLTGIAAFVPILLSEQGVLWILGQSLIYSASVFGIAAYFRSEAVQMKHDIERYFDRKERLQEERYKLRNGIDEGEIPDEEES